MKTYPVGLVPGPVSVPREIREAWLTDYASSDIEAEFYDLYHENQALTQELLETKNDVVISSGEAMSILWGGLKSSLTPGKDKLLAVASGLFGEGFADMARDIGCEAEVVAAPYSSLPNVEDVRAAARRLHPNLVTAVHCETPCGTLNPYLKEIGEVAHEVGALFLVDFVSSGGGTPVRVDEWNIDIGLLGSQKALSLPPSLSVSTISERAWEVFDAVNYQGYDAYLPWREIPKTPPCPYTHDWYGNAGLNTSLKALMAEGLEEVYSRHERVARLCRERGREMGLELFPESDAISSPTVTAFYTPSGWTWESFDTALRKRGLAVGGNYSSLAGKVFRIGHMGSQAQEELVTRGMKIIEEVLS